MKNVFLLASGGENIILTILLGIGIAIVLFLLLREVICWYYKINERITLQKKTNALLEELLKQKNQTQS